MAHDHNDIYSIVERLRVLEEGLDKNQRSVNQLSATFRPKTVAVLTAKTDPKNPMAGKLVGGCEEDKEVAEDAGMTWDGVSPDTKEFTSEDVLEKVAKSFTDYLKSVADEIKQDTDLRDKKQEDTDIKKKDKKDRDLITKEGSTEPDDDDWYDDQEDLPSDYAYQRGESPYDKPEPQTESKLCKTITNESGTWMIHEAGASSFAIRHGNRELPTRFKNLDEAEIALEMFNIRRRGSDETPDYIDEA